MRLLKLTRRIGVRGVILLHFGIPFIALGVGYYKTPDDRDRFSRPGPGAQLELMDSHWWGILWILCGIISCFIAFSRVHSKHDAAGFGLLVVPPALWTTCFAISWIEFVVTQGALGQGHSYLGFFVFGIFTSLILFLSSVRDPDDPTMGRNNLE